MEEHLLQSLILYSDRVSSIVKCGGGTLQRLGRKEISIDDCMPVQNNSGTVKGNRGASEGSGSISG